MLRLVQTVVSLIFMVPAVLAICLCRPFIGIACIASAFTSLLHSNYVDVEYASLSTLQAMDAIAAVSLTLVCSLHLYVHKSIIGILRVFWLVTLVTSSSSYDFFKGLAPNVSFIPNDITIITLAVCGILLMFTTIYSRFCVSSDQTRDKRSIVVELMFVAGAMILRFEEDVESLVHVLIGWISWYVFAIFAALTTLHILKTLQPSSAGNAPDDLRRHMDADSDSEV